MEIGWEIGLGIREDIGSGFWRSVWGLGDTSASTFERSVWGLGDWGIQGIGFRGIKDQSGIGGRV